MDELYIYPVITLDGQDVLVTTTVVLYVSCSLIFFLPVKNCLVIYTGQSLDARILRVHWPFKMAVYKGFFCGFLFGHIPSNIPLRSNTSEGPDRTKHGSHCFITSKILVFKLGLKHLLYMTHFEIQETQK